MTESPAWLLAKGRIKEGQEATRYMCRANGNLEKCEQLIEDLANTNESETKPIEEENQQKEQ